MSTTTTETRSLGAGGVSCRLWASARGPLAVRSPSTAATPGGVRLTTRRVSARCTWRSTQASR